METRNVDPLATLLDEIDRGWDGKVRRGHYLSPEGDCLFVYNEPVSYFAERIDGLLTVYRALGEGEGRIIGLQIKGLKGLGVDMVGARVWTCDGDTGPHIVQLLLRSWDEKPTAAYDKGRRESAYAEAIKLACAA
jgi:hypothetical protein